MNGKDLFDGLGSISQKYYDQAENGTITPARKSFRKPFLAAAIISMMLLLTGCAVVYMLKMQNLKIADQAATKPVFETNGMDIAGYEDINQQILTVVGLKGTNGYQAALEWYNFKQEYDPDHSIIVGLMAEDKVPEYPAEYDAYNIYSQEMKDKLDSILQTYNLKPMGENQVFRTAENQITALGVEDFFIGGTGATIQNLGGGCYENGNFYLNLDVILPKDGNSEVSSTSGVLLWNQKDCFSEETFTIEDTGDWQEWNYTTASGFDVLIMRSPSDWKGWIICDRGDAIIATWITTRNDLGNNDGEKTWWDHQYMTDRQIEMVADAIDFGIQPRKVTKEDVLNQPGVPDAATQDGYTVKLKSVQSDGQQAYITLSITAPEGAIINRNLRDETIPYYITPSNRDILTPATGKLGTRSFDYIPTEDNDGLDNTQDFILAPSLEMADRDKPFAPGAVWTLRIENLTTSYWDGQNAIEETLAEGEWQFDITIQDSNGDFREIELIDTPVTTQACTGWEFDGTEVYENVEITSFTLRSFGASIVSNDRSASFGNNTDKKIYAVMKDGNLIHLCDIGSWNLRAETRIDVTQVDHVLLPDGTKLFAPELPVD